MGPAVCCSPADVIAKREEGQRQADQGRPDERRTSEIGGNQAAHGEFNADRRKAADEDEQPEQWS